MSFSVVNNFGLELPEYPPESVLGRGQLRKLGRTPPPDEETFVRVARIAYNGFKDLKGCLSLADKELAAAAEVCEAKVVEHTWGRTYLTSEELEDRDYYGNAHDVQFLLPGKFVLVAEVNIIDATHRIPSGLNPKFIKDNLRSYTETGGLLADLDPLQYMMGVERGTGYNGRLLQDIDPLMRDRHPIST